MNPYKIIDQTESSVTYEYRTINTWILYILLIVVLWGNASNHDFLIEIGCALIITLFALKFVLGRTASKEIKNALKNGMVEFSGNKHSFKNPIRIKIPRKVEASD